jgi:hypothetical protein
MGKHFNAKHEDETWVRLFRRWHAGQDARALRAEAGVSRDTWSAHAARLGMRLCDLAPDHPARRRVPAFADRADDYRHPNSRLDEGAWRALFALKAQGVPDTVLSVRFGVHRATICSQAQVRGIRRADVRAATGAAQDAWGGEDASTPCPSPMLSEGEATTALSGVKIVTSDPVRTMASFDAAIAEAGAAGAFMRVAMACKAKLSVQRAVFGSPGPAHPVAPGDDAGHDSGPEGEGEAAVPEPVLRASQRPPEGDWTTWLFLGGRGAGKTLAGAMWLSDQAQAMGTDEVPGGGGAGVLGRGPGQSAGAAVRGGLLAA